MFEVIRRKDLERSRELNLKSTEGEAAVAAVQSYVTLASTRLQSDLAMEFENQLKELLDYLRKRADAGASTVSASFTLSGTAAISGVSVGPGQTQLTLIW